jgi:integrase
MPRGPKPTVRYWKSRKAYACWIGEDRHFLARGPDDAPGGPTYLEALDKFRKLVAQDDKVGTDDYLVSALLNQYRAHLKTTRKSGAPGVFEVLARRFAVKFGKLKVCDLKPYAFDQWLNGQETWNPTTKAHAVALILGALSWSVRKGFILTNPLAGKIERPVPLLRGREARLSDGLMDVLIAECFERATYNRRNRTGTPAVHLRNVGFTEQFGRLLWLLRSTGARPIELRKAEAHNYQNGKLVFRWNATRGYLHKTSAKTRRDRIIFLSPEAKAYVEECVAKHPDGVLFRTLRGDEWGLTNCTQKWRQWLLKRPRVVAYMREHEINPKEVKIYGFRHAAISKWLDDGGDIYVAAQLFGTSVRMIEQRYGSPDIDKLQDRFLAFSHRNPLPMPTTAAIPHG